VRLKSALAAIATGCAFAACTSAPIDPSRVLTVDEMLGHAAGLEGKTIRVSGVVGPCGGPTCTLLGSRADFEAYVLAMTQNPDGEQRSALRSIQIANAVAIQPFMTKSVVITGRAVKGCKHVIILSTCLDGADVEPTKIEVIKTTGALRPTSKEL